MPLDKIPQYERDILTTIKPELLQSLQGGTYYNRYKSLFSFGIFLTTLCYLFGGPIWSLLGVKLQSMMLVRLLCLLILRLFRWDIPILVLVSIVGSIIDGHVDIYIEEASSNESTQAQARSHLGLDGNPFAYAEGVLNEDSLNMWMDMIWNAFSLYLNEIDSINLKFSEIPRYEFEDAVRLHLKYKVTWKEAESIFSQICERPWPSYSYAVRTSIYPHLYNLVEKARRP